MSNHNILTKEDKLKAIGLPEDYDNKGLTDEVLNDKYDKINKTDETVVNKMKKKTNSNTYTKKQKYQKVDNDSETYKITLEFLNCILKVIDKPEITNIIEFKDIKRDDLLKPEFNQSLTNNINKIIDHFGKSKIRYNMKNKFDCYVLTVIKYLTSFCGYQFVSKHVNEITIESKCNYNYTKVIYCSII